MADYGRQRLKNRGKYAPKPGETRLERARREMNAANARCQDNKNGAAAASFERARAEFLEAKKAARLTDD